MRMNGIVFCLFTIPFLNGISSQQRFFFVKEKTARSVQPDTEIPPENIMQKNDLSGFPTGHFFDPVVQFAVERGRDQQIEAIDRATRSVYRFETVLNSPYFKYPMYDLADYAHKVAMETADQEFAAIAADIDAAFSDAILRYEDVNWNSERFLPHYTLSVCLVDHDAYTHDFMNDPSMKTPLCNFNEGYEQTSFHRITGWGAWLNNNLQRPQGRKGDWQDKE